ncbi:uncharacterized protein LOC141696933 [Apium graveolens]|uniref:uncharacterized protein LOC141696933 n=1 Tax=Apium graveolens TaxID=4045 RepID=UPI003D7A1F8F
MKGIKICLYVEHYFPEMNRSIYMIEPPVDLAEYEEKEMDCDGFVVDTVSPIIALEQEEVIDCFITAPAMFQLGSRIYFIGGGSIPDLCDEVDELADFPCESKQIVRFIDIERDPKKLCTVASLNAPKATPCVFSAHGLIYVLGSVPPGSSHQRRPRPCNLFERYHPIEDKWELLPDPPFPFGLQHRMDFATLFDSATVFEDRYVFVGNSTMVVCFDLNTLKWMFCRKQPPRYEMRFPCGSLYVDACLYYLRGRDAWKVGNEFDPARWVEETCTWQVNLVKKGPLELNDIKFLNGQCVLPKQEQLIATIEELEPDLEGSFFTDRFREIFHLGGRFFCYVVTAWLTSIHGNNQPNCRGVWIKVFEELPGSEHPPQPHFRTLASFCYKIRTKFRCDDYFIRCCAFGSVPDSWVKTPMKKNHVVTKERKVLKVEQSHHEHGGGGKGQGNCILEKSVAAPEEEIIRLKAELAKKDELLKAYEAAALAQKA